MLDENDKPLMPGELAALMGCSRPVIDAAIKAGEIPAARIGRRFFIPRRVATEILNNGRIPQPLTPTSR